MRGRKDKGRKNWGDEARLLVVALRRIGVLGEKKNKTGESGRRERSKDYGGRKGSRMGRRKEGGWEGRMEGFASWEEDK